MTPTENRQFIGDGADGLVYRLGDDRVAKFQYAREGLKSLFWKVSPTGERIQQEYEISRILYENGVSVPEPYGIFKLKKPDEEDNLVPFFLQDKYPAFVMEYVEGQIPNPKYLSVPFQRKIDELVKIEREKVKDLGLFQPEDADGWENTLWCPSKEKIYLIDFTQWEII